METKMWHHVAEFLMRDVVSHVTNGVHVPSWDARMVSPEKYLGLAQSSGR
jgi:hypothetical protein